MADVRQLLALAITVETPTTDGGNYGEHIRDIAKQAEKDIRQPCPGAPPGIGHLPAESTGGPARVRGMVGPEKNQEIERQRRQHIQAHLPDYPDQFRSKGRSLGLFPGRLGHSIPRVRA